MIILSKVLKESNQFKILAIKVAAKRTLDNALLLIRRPPGYAPPIGEVLRTAMNAQIRALTGGDITKEEAVLSMDTWRALTELDAKAKEVEDTKRQTK